MKKIISLFTRLLAKIIGRKKIESLLVYSAKSIGVNLHVHGLVQIGTGTGIYLGNEGEIYFIKNILTRLFSPEHAPIFFDIGANIGAYTLELKKYFPKAIIYSFEPVKNTFELLTANVGQKAILQNIGFSNFQGLGVLYNAKNNIISEVSTSQKDALQDIYKTSIEFETIEYESDTIDNFCFKNNITAIDFLKIDVEGNELQVLQGAINMLSTTAIKIIQFEFNVHNVYSRVFLHDFYLLLKEYCFYRIRNNNLLPLGEYDAVNEIFLAQNIIAIRKDVLPQHAKII